MHACGLCYSPVSRDKLYASLSNVVSISVMDSTTECVLHRLQISLRFAVIIETFGTLFLFWFFCCNILGIFDTSELLKYPTIGRLMASQEDFSNF
jgi:hypothetical protein